MDYKGVKHLTEDQHQIITNFSNNRKLQLLNVSLLISYKTIILYL